MILKVQKAFVLSEIFTGIDKALGLNLIEKYFNYSFIINLNKELSL